MNNTSECVEPQLALFLGQVPVNGMERGGVLSINGDCTAQWPLYCCPPTLLPGALSLRPGIPAVQFHSCIPSCSQMPEFLCLI